MSQRARVASRFGLIAVLLAGFAVTTTAAAASAVITKIEIKQAGDQTDVVFHTGSQPRFKYFQLSGPPRGVVDFADSNAADGTAKAAGGAVRHVRLAGHDDGSLRAVLDLVDGAHLDSVADSGGNIVAHISGGKQTVPEASGGSQSGAESSATGADNSSDDQDRGSADVPEAVYRAAAETGPVVVVIDPGHGGHDSGTTAASGLKEKTVALAIARRLYAKLKATKSIHPVLTRDHDTFVTLRQRVRIAQEHHANLFVSIHQNAYPKSTSVDGGTCYVLSQHGATDAKSAQLAHFENSADRNVAGVQFSDTDHTLNAVLTDLYQNASINDAEDLADAIITNFAQVGPLYRRTPPRANFAVLRDPMIPSVLCETAFLSNPGQAHKLAGSTFRNQLADAMFDGIMGYFREHPPERMQATGAGRSYTVKAGDTLSGIAAKSSVSANVLMDINHLHTKRLKVGQKLEVPGG